MWSTAKTSSCLILFGLSVVSGLLSCLLVRCLAERLGASSKFKRALSVLNCFSGGVFFATSILELLPEARESMTKALKHYKAETDYPLTEVLMGLGFLLILSLEHFAHMCFSESKTKQFKPPENFKNKTNVIKGNSLRDASIKYKKLNQKYDDLDQTEGDIRVADFEDSSYLDDATYHTYGTVDESIDTSVMNNTRRDIIASPKPTQIMFEGSEEIIFKDIAHQIYTGHDGDHSKTSAALKAACESSIGDAHVSQIRGMVLLLALSLHMIFDGLALGLFDSSTKIWRLLLALSLHKVLVFFTIAIQTLEILKTVRKSVLAIMIFSLVSPCGVIIGESVSSSGDEISSDTASAILQGIATGTFVFVTFFEILQRELSAIEHDLVNVFATVLGFALIASVKLIENDEEP